VSACLVRDAAAIANSPDNFRPEAVMAAAVNGGCLEIPDGTKVLVLTPPGPIVAIQQDLRGVIIPPRWVPAHVIKNDRGQDPFSMAAFSIDCNAAP
jgi:hypothetical protein